MDSKKRFNNQNPRLQIIRSFRRVKRRTIYIHDVSVQIDDKNINYAIVEQHNVFLARINLKRKLTRHHHAANKIAHRQSRIYTQAVSRTSDNQGIVISIDDCY